MNSTYITELSLVGSGVSLPILDAAMKAAGIAKIEAAGSEPSTTNTDGVKSVTNPKFTPGGEAEKLLPKAGDFISFPFRALSATTVAAGTYRATEFPESVLRDSVELLNGQTAFENHWADPSNSVGLSENSSWANRSLQNGIIIPAGINTDIRVDVTTNKEIARKMLTGEICCVSVKVKFEWKPSHQFEKEWEFYEQMGEMQPDGTMCRRIATKILQYQEISIVNVGADPYAGMIDSEGMLRKIDSTQIYNIEGFKADETQKPSSQSAVDNSKMCLIALNKETLMLTKTPEGEEKATNQQFVEQLSLRKKENEALALKIKEGEEALANKIVEISQLSAKLTTATESLATVTSELAKSKIAADKWEAHMVARRDYVVDLYKKSTESPSEPIIALISKSDDTTLEALEKEYMGKVEQMFSFKCKKCESTEYSLQSSNNNGKKTPELGEPKKEIPAFAEPEIHEVI
jgi:hypothetical protein